MGTKADRMRWLKRYERITKKTGTYSEYIARTSTLRKLKILCAQAMIHHNEIKHILEPPRPFLCEGFTLTESS